MEKEDAKVGRLRLFVCKNMMRHSRLAAHSVCTVVRALILRNERLEEEEEDKREQRWHLTLQPAFLFSGWRRSGVLDVPKHVGRVAFIERTRFLEGPSCLASPCVHRRG